VIIRLKNSGDGEELLLEDIEAKKKDTGRITIMARTKKEKEVKEEPLEKQLWKAADKLRKNIDAAEYKHVVLGLIFLKYISDSFEELFSKLQKGEGVYDGADPEDKDEYKAENVFFVPPEARWSFLLAKAKQPDIGKFVDAAMDAIEKENASLKGVLPKVFARQNLDPASLGSLIDLVGNIALGDAKARSADVLGHVFEYFLGEFALAEGKQGGQFYTPRSIVELLVSMLEPYKGRVFDPCCGSGGMFVQSEKFVEEHQGRVNDISIFGQESNQTTWRLAKMNLAIRGIDSSQVKWNNEGSFLNDAHKDLRADFIIANPPFNDSDWSGDQLRSDGRWQFGTPPAGNANFAWMQHFIYHLAPNGKAGVVLAKGALTGKSSGEGDIRKSMIEEGNLIDCIVNMPAKLFLNTQIPAALWFLNRARNNGHPRKGEILFIDSRNLGHLINRRTREFSHDDIQKIAAVYHAWRTGEGDYEDEKGFCASVPLSRVAELDYVLTPGRYVGLPDEEDDFNFAERFNTLKAEFEAQLLEEVTLNKAIAESLARVKI
jgi:type I restriction enzyme M protein